MTSVNDDVRVDPVPAAADGEVNVLTVDRLGVSAGELGLVCDISFALRRGERVGLIGESGSGKSLTALALLGLLPDDLRTTGSVRLSGVDGDLVGADERHLNKIRGRRVAMVFQEPMTALNPLMRVGKQIAEAMLLHGTRPNRRSARQSALELLGRVGMPDPGDAVRAYPHQLSGGQRQRVMLAIALANDPDLLICDEPTTALDVTVQAQILQVILEGVTERGSSLLFITHDLAVMAKICQRVLVMYGGRILEAGTVLEIFTNPRHPYTRGLLAASDLETTDPDGRLPAIAGALPAAGRFPDGCVFRDRCPRAVEESLALPSWTGDEMQGFACWNPAGDDD
jgi:oligopeptide/dipeptide ABC transporter ATP-binding protein